MIYKKHLISSALGIVLLFVAFISLVFVKPIYAQTDLGIHTNPHLITKSLYQINNIIKIPLTRQATSYTCGVAALQSVLSYYGDDYNERELEIALHANSFCARTRI